VPTIRKKRVAAPYHHGDLRNELVSSTLQLIDGVGTEGFSLREVARQAGVSPRAPYQHFENKAALLAEIARRGYELLADALRKAAAPARTQGDAVRRMMDAYVVFSRTHRSHFRVMFRPAVYDKPRHPEVAEAGDRAMAVLVDVIASLARGARSTPSPERLAVLAWATAHGAASLLEDGALERRSAALGSNPLELLSECASNFEALLDR
jgi:AcrR family transcriptional regulator